ncbi:MAG: glycosyltransferase family 2 protein [Novosphingobium sp.]
MRISTIIPAYNRADLIGETLRTVLSQSLPPHEVIVVDDGSSDGTPDAVAAFGKDVTLIRQANAGAGPARNAGFARSSGDVIHFMDSDDLCSLNSYEAAMRRFEAGADMVYGPWLKTRFNGTRLDPEPFVLQQGPIASTRPNDVLALMVDWVTVFQPCLFRRELIERAGPYRADLKPSEDTELLYRIMAAARAPAHVAEALVLYRVHPENQVSEQNLGRRLIDRANLWSVLEQHAKARDDLDATFWRRFRRRKYEVAVEVREYDAARAEALESDVGVADRMLHPLRQFARRVRMRLQVMATGNPYPRTLSAAPISPGQREQVRLLGYELP